MTPSHLLLHCDYPHGCIARTVGSEASLAVREEDIWLAHGSRAHVGRRDRVCQEPAFRLGPLGNGHRCSPIAPRCGPPSTTRTSTMRSDHRCTDCATLQGCSSAWWGIVSQAMVTCARRVAIAVRVTCGGRHIYTCACARRQRCIRVHTNRHVSPPHRPTSPYGHRVRYAVRCTTF